MTENISATLDERLTEDIDLLEQETTDEGDEMYEHFAVTVDKGQSMMRLDKYLTIRLEHTSRNRIQAAADAGNILVNGVSVKSSYKIKPFDQISLMMPYPKREVEIIPENILNLPKYGCVNVHASLLPRHRGASPIQTSILVGDAVTGVTTQKMDIGVDTGDILLAEKCDIISTDTFETLHDKLAVMGAKLLVDTVDGLKNGTIVPLKQPEDGVTHCSIITKEMGQIDFNKTACEIDCLIRAFTPWPSAFFFMNGSGA